MNRTKHQVRIHTGTCPDCEQDGRALLPSLDGSEVHLICMDCNRVYAKSVTPGVRVQKWRDLGPWVRI